MELFCSGTRNHLDVPLDDHDRIFVRDNTDDGRGWWCGGYVYLDDGMATCRLAAGVRDVDAV